LLPGKGSERQRFSKERFETASRATVQGYQQEVERACKQRVQDGKEMVARDKEACKIWQKQNRTLKTKCWQISSVNLSMFHFPGAKI